MENNNSNINPQLNYIMKGTQPFITNKIGQQQQQMNVNNKFLFRNNSFYFKNYIKIRQLIQ